MRASALAGFGARFGLSVPRFRLVRACVRASVRVCGRVHFSQLATEASGCRGLVRAILVVAKLPPEAKWSLRYRGGFGQFQVYDPAGRRGGFVWEGGCCVASIGG